MRKTLMNLVTAGLITATSLVIGGCGNYIPHGATYIVDEHGRQHRVSEEELQKMQEKRFEGIICNYVEDRDNSGKTGDSWDDFVGRDKSTFYTNEGITICGLAWNYERCELTTEIRRDNGSLFFRDNTEITKGYSDGYKLNPERLQMEKNDQKFIVEWYINGTPVKRKTFILRRE